MTIANTFASKLFVGFVAIAMALSFVAPAQAATEAELQAQIDALMATINSLQSEVGQTTSSASVCPYAWTRSLSSGSTGADVMKLQQFLNADAATQVAVTGAGSAGMETEYFGPATAAAVSNFQVMYRDSILTPAGLVNPTGYFGPSSMAKANALCVAGSTDDTDDSTDDTDDSTDDSDVTLSGEASLGDVDLQDGDDTSVEEGQEAAPVADFEVQFDNGDAVIDRIDVAFTATGEEDAWDTFEEVSLWVDGDEVATVAADDKDEYLGDEDDGVLRFSGLDLVAMEDEDVTITIAVTVQGSVDQLTATWDVDVTEIRYSDADDVTSTDDVTVDATSFDIDMEGGDDELAVKTSSEDPDATTLQLDDTDKSDLTTVFAFDLDTKDSTNDITLNTIPVTIVVANDTFGDIVNDLTLSIDGEEFDDWSYSVGAAGSTTVTVEFDIDGDLVIDAGDRVTAQLQVEFKALATEGATIQGKVLAADANSIDAEGADDLDNTSPDQLTGSATGEVHTLRSTGAVIELTSTTETFKANTDATTTDDSGTFVLKFDVTAFENDMFINKTAASSTASAGTEGVHYIITDGSGTAVSVGTPTENLSSSADTVGTQYKVAEGETETFTLTVSLDPNAEGFYGVQLYSVNYNPNEASDPDDADGVYQRALPASDFESDALEITN